MSRHFLSIGEAMIEMAGGAGGHWRMGVAGDTLSAPTSGGGLACFVFHRAR